MKLSQRYLEEDLLSSRIYDLLYYLGVSANYAGFFYIAHALRLCVEEPERLTLVTKWLYPDIAKFYGTNWKAVEGSMRATINRLWKTDPERYFEITGTRTEEKPSPAKFLFTLTEHLQQNRAVQPRYLFRY